VACELGLVVTVASGSRLAARFAELAAEHDDVSALHVVLSDGARLAVADELGRERATSLGFVNGLALSSAAREKVRTWAEADLGAPIASGPHILGGVVILPSSAATARSLAHGVSRGLAQRLGDIALKHRWPLLLAYRESPPPPFTRSTPATGAPRYGRCRHGACRGILSGRWRLLRSPRCWPGSTPSSPRATWSVSTPPSSAPTARSHPRCLRSTSLI
jgi:3-polyprenyl-4-hydroxybenzoate decarboxylase